MEFQPGVRRMKRLIVLFVLCCLTILLGCGGTKQLPASDARDDFVPPSDVAATDWNLVDVLEDAAVLWEVQADEKGDRDQELELTMDDSDGIAEPFVEFEWLSQPADPAQRICDESTSPDDAPDKVFIHCPIEGEHLAPTQTEPKDELVVWAYNIERGHSMDAQVAAILSGENGPLPDVLLMSELDRGCSRTGYRHVAREYAAALGMNYLFAVEFVELKGAPGSHVAHCEHGNAILSRYPLGNVRAFRHKSQHVWYDDDSQPRLGGRIALSADVLVGDRVLHVYSVHFESQTEEARSAQAMETALDAETLSGPAVVGGDMNCGLVMLDLMNGTQFDETLVQFTSRGWFDAHEGLSIEERVTAPEHNFVLDILVGTRDQFKNPGVGSKSSFATLSDHLPVWASVVLE